MEISAIWRASSKLLQDKFWPTRARVTSTKHLFRSCLVALVNGRIVKEITVTKTKYKLTKCSPRKELNWKMTTVLLTMQLHNASKIWSTLGLIFQVMKLMIISLRKYKFVNPHFQRINKTWIIISMTQNIYSNILMLNSNTNILGPQCHQKGKLESRVRKTK